MQRIATKRRSFWNPSCPAYIQGLHLSGAVPGLFSTMLIKVINTDGAQKGPCSGSVPVNSNSNSNKKFDN